MLILSGLMCLIDMVPVTAPVLVFINGLQFICEVDDCTISAKYQMCSGTAQYYNDCD